MSNNLQLEWINKVVSDDGDSLRLHYLIDKVDDRCYATICEPVGGGILFGTDLKFDCPDRWYASLDGAKTYCEFAATVENEMDAEDLLDYVENGGEDFICEDCQREAEEAASRAIPHQHPN